MKIPFHQFSFEPQQENRRSFLLLRWLVIILASYLMLFSNLESENFVLIFGFVVAMSLSNLVMAVLPMPLFVSARSQHWLSLTDALFISLSLYILRVPDLPIHFPLIGVFLLALVSRDFRVVLFSLFAVSLIFAAFSYLSTFGDGTDMAVRQFLELALLFIVAIFYVLLVDRFDREAASSTSMLEETRNSETMVEITRALSTTMDPEEIYRVIVSRLSKVIDGAECAVVRIESETAVVLANSADSGSEPRPPIRLETAPALAAAIRERRSVYHRSGFPTSDGAAEPALAIPMMARGEVLGLVCFHGGRVTEPSSTTVHFFEVAAGTSANALRNVQMFEEMRHMARTDFMTGLPNHRYFQSALARELGRAQRHEHTVSLLMIDLDFLKSINDRFGHPTGDLLIRSVADTIRNTCREIDFAARYGGEEFVVILPETDLDGAILAAERIRKNIAAVDIGPGRQVTASVGISNFPANAKTKEDLIRVADQALYVAKKGGRNKVAHFTYQLATRTLS